MTQLLPPSAQAPAAAPVPDVPAWLRRTANACLTFTGLGVVWAATPLCLRAFGPERAPVVAVLATLLFGVALFGVYACDPRSPLQKRRRARHHG